MQPYRVKLSGNFAPFLSATNEGGQKLKLKIDEFIHIPVGSVIKQWMSNETFNNIVCLRKKRTDDVLSSYADGRQFLEHPYRLRHPNSLLLKLYYDEVDMCDVAGSKSSREQKFGTFYWMFEDMSPAFSSRTKYINLTGIV